MKLVTSLAVLLFILVFIYHVSCEWLSFAEFLKLDKTDTANIIRARDNCDANTIQIIPGDCRPIY
jgi:hypothetical protein